MMFSVFFSAAAPCQQFFHSLPGYRYMTQKKILNSAYRFFGAGLFFLIVLLSAELAFAVDVTLSWDPNSETDLEGYGVYFNKGTPGPPYNLFGYITTGELSNPDTPMFAVTGLDKGARYYFAVTAYDTEGNESYFSNSVCANVGDVIAPCSSGGGGDSSGGGGSGGGAGCFIETVSADAARFNPGLVSLTAWGVMVAVLIFVAKRHPGRLLPYLARNALRIRPVNKAGRDAPLFIRNDRK
jgi:hypothetical protein